MLKFSTTEEFNAQIKSLGLQSLKTLGSMFIQNRITNRKRELENEKKEKQQKHVEGGKEEQGTRMRMRRAREKRKGERVSWQEHDFNNIKIPEFMIYSFLPTRRVKTSLST